MVVNAVGHVDAQRILSVAEHSAQFIHGAVRVHVQAVHRQVAVVRIDRVHGQGVLTFSARTVFASAIVFGGCHVVVAGEWIVATVDLIDVANPVVVGVRLGASAIAISHGKPFATPVIHVGRVVVVAGSGVGATWHFNVVAHTVHVVVLGAVTSTHAGRIQGVAVAIASSIRDAHTTPIVRGGRRVVVARIRIHASRNFASAFRIRASTVKHDGRLHFVCPHTKWEHLEVDLARNVSCRGDLGHQPASIGWQGVGGCVQHIP